MSSISSIKRISFISIIAASVLFTKCTEDGSKQKGADKIEPEKKEETIKSQLSEFFIQNEKGKYATGDTILFTVNPIGTELDSVHFFVNGKLMFRDYSYPFNFEWNSADAKTGKQVIKSVSYSKEQEEVNRINLKLFSDIIPEEFTYKVKKTYEHDPGAYTQGLVYVNGVMYEGTGQYGESTLRKVKLETGVPELVYNLPDDIFGEGIELYDNKIVQLSWQSRIGYVYDKNSFSLLNKFPLQTEGWGITSYKDMLIMSDGTSNLYLIEKETFSEAGTIEVYDNNGPVVNLNELENINGEIYANIYTTNYIVVIDPETGKVTKRIDLTGILKPEYITGRIDVLNGIAYDFDKKRLFVTGKWWPKLFEIELVKK